MQATQTQALLLGGDRYHNADEASQYIGTALRAEGLTLVTTTDFRGLGQDMLSGKGLLVILRDGTEWLQGQPVAWMEPAQEEAIEQFVLSGGGFLALHNAGWAYPWRDGYRRTLGGYYIGHPALAPFHVEVVNHEHPVTAGVESYEITDEQHWLYCDYDRVQVLLVSQGQDGRQSVAGWAHQYGQGRVVYLPHGHTPESLSHPAFQRLVRNAARWLLGRS